MASRLVVMGRLAATEVVEAMVAMFASGDPSEAANVVADDYLDHQGVGGEEVERETIDIVRVADGRAVEHWGARA